MIGAVRMVQRNALVYRHVWRGSVFSSFLQPTLFLIAMGLGLGAMIDPRAAALPGGVRYVEFLAPGLLAAAVMQAATFESTYPVLGKMTWHRNYEAISATPMRPSDLVLGELAWIAVRLATIATAFMPRHGGVRDSAIPTRASGHSGRRADRARVRRADHGVRRDAGRIRAHSTCCFDSASRRCFCFPACSSRSPACPDGSQSSGVVHAAVSWRRAGAQRHLGPALPPRGAARQLPGSADCGRDGGGTRDIPSKAARMSTIAAALPSLRRSSRMVQRNLLVYKHTWMVIASGFFEPLFYLLGIGIGLGSLVPEIDGVSYRAFVAPGLLASSCLNGAITDGFFNIFFKLHFQKTYDGILATPMRVPDVAFGEMLWALGRGSLYAAAFLVVLLVLGEATDQPMLLSRWAVLAWPAAVLAAASFSAMALLLSSVARKVQDFDMVMGLLVMPMFLFSGIFVPIGRFPEAVQWIMRATPLYHAVSMLRQITTGTIDVAIVGHLTYLIVGGAVAFSLAMYRLERALIK